MTSSPYAVIGATGQQGSAVVEALLEAGAPVRALVRDPDATRAVALRDRGVELVRADQEDTASLRSALRGAAGLWFVTTFAGDDGPDGEVRRGVAVAEAASDAGVPHVVYSSVGGSERETGIPHFESKRRVEERLTDLVASTFVRPTFFMENLGSAIDGHDGGAFVLRLPMPGDVPLQMVAVRDVGRIAALLLRRPDLVDGAVEIAGDERSPVPVEALDNPDAEAMFRWFARVPAYRADLDATIRLDPDVLDLPGWVRTRGSRKLE